MGTSVGSFVRSSSPAYFIPMDKGFEAPSDRYVNADQIGGGLFSSCGRFNEGRGVNDNGEELGLHGSHSNTAAELESIYEPIQGRTLMAIVGRVRYGKLFGPCVELRRTIASQLGSNRIDI